MEFSITCLKIFNVKNICLLSLFEKTSLKIHWQLITLQEEYFYPTVRTVSINLHGEAFCRHNAIEVQLIHYFFHRFLPCFPCVASYSL